MKLIPMKVSLGLDCNINKKGGGVASTHTEQMYMITQNTVSFCQGILVAGE